MVSGDAVLRHSFYVNKERALDAFPQLNDENLSGAMIYFDGQQNDARMCLALAVTAARMGANVANYVEVTNLIKRRDGWKDYVKGAIVRDLTTGNEFTIRAKCVINATGPFTDNIRKIDNSITEPICAPSSGTHIVLPDYFCPRDIGLINAKSSDGRVIFMLPWEGVTICGTTDIKCATTFEPTPTEREIDFILKEIQKVVNLDVGRGDVLSAWSGIRPLVRDPNAKDTKSIARNHIIEVSPSHLITIAGGKWTTYRSMAEETVERAIEECKLKPDKGFSQTIGFVLEGAHDYDTNHFIRLINDFGVDHQVAKHLSQQYGDQSVEVMKLAGLTGKTWPVTGVRLVEHYPYLEAEVRYAVRVQYAMNAVDVIARRTRLAFQDTDAARQALPRVLEIMGEELNWTDDEKERQNTDASNFLDTQMGYMAIRSDAKMIPRDIINTCVNGFLEQQPTPGKGLSYKHAAALASELHLGSFSEEEIGVILSNVNIVHRVKEISALEFLVLAGELRRILEHTASEERKQHLPFKPSPEETAPR